MIPEEWLIQASDRLRSYVLQTPLIHDPENKLFLKLENLQITGSFKFRGALNRVMTLSEDERKIVVTASAGNHGLGVARSVRLIGGKAIIYVSNHAVPEKIYAIQKEGAEIREVPGGYGDAEKVGMRFAREGGGTWISPYNDGQVIAGQSTVGLELIEQLKGFQFKSVIVPVGGGGLLAGIGLAFQQSDAHLQLYGVNPEESQFFHALFTRGSQEGIEDNPTLADGLAGAIESGTITLPILKQLGAKITVVAENEIRSAIKIAWWKYGQRVEGSAAIALAAGLNLSEIEKPAVVILTGGNIQPEVFTSIMKTGSLDAG